MVSAVVRLQTGQQDDTAIMAPVLQDQVAPIHTEGKATLRGVQIEDVGPRATSKETHS